MRTPLSALALALLVAASALAATGMSWTLERRPDFACERPVDWDLRALSGSEPGAFLSDGWASIRALRRSGEKQPSLAAAKQRLTREDTLESKLKVAGRESIQLTRRFLQTGGGDDGAATARWTYEESVLVPGKKGYWLLQYRIPISGPTAAVDRQVWERFLKSFSPKA